MAHDLNDIDLNPNRTPSLRGATRRGNLIDLNQAQKDCHTTSWFAMTGFWLK